MFDKSLRGLVSTVHHKHRDEFGQGLRNELRSITTTASNWKFLETSERTSFLASCQEVLKQRKILLEQLGRFFSNS